MQIKLEIQILGEILQVRDSGSSTAWSSIYPGKLFSTRGVQFAYDELRSMGNGKTTLKRNEPIEEMVVGSKDSS